MSENIMVVDDEHEIADLVEVYLNNEGFNVLKFDNAGDALACVEHEDVSLAVLDVMLPDMSGFALCSRIREHHVFPIIMLTAKVEDIDKIRGITLGADDYVTKPFNPLELTARVKAQIRRYKKYDAVQQPEDITEYEFLGLTINSESRKCTLYGEECQLTPIEFNILWYLCSNRGRVISSEELFEAVWGEKYIDSNNTVMAHIARLREKLKEPARRPKIIKTVWGVGYTIE